MKIFSVMVTLLLLTVSQASSQEAKDLETSIREMAEELAEKLSSDEVGKFAVIEFTNLTGYKSVLGAFIAEDLITQLFEAKPGAFDGRFRSLCG